MKICNRKLAARIEANEAAFVKLVTERQFVISKEDYQRAKTEIETAIKRDVDTLAAHGYDRTGRKVVRG